MSDDNIYNKRTVPVNVRLIEHEYSWDADRQTDDTRDDDDIDDEDDVLMNLSLQSSSVWCHLANYDWYSLFLCERM